MAKKKVRKTVKKKAKKTVKKQDSLSRHLRGRSKEDLLRDKKRKAKKPGKRTTKRGSSYTETRVNRSDHNPKHRI
jgi:hypothetical protein